MITAPMADVVESLSQVPLFAGVGREKLAKLSDRMAERSFSEGKAATEEGKGGAGFWVIEEGEATVAVEGRDRANARARRLLRRDRAARRWRRDRPRSPR